MEIRRIEAKAVTDTVKELFLRCNYEIGQDILDALAQAREREPSALGREVLGQLLETTGSPPRSSSRSVRIRAWRFYLWNTATR